MKSGDPSILFLNTNGVPSTEKRDNSYFFWQDQNKEWISDAGRYYPEIDNKCVSVRNSIADKVFGSLLCYMELSANTSSAVIQAGLNSECPISRNQFEQLVSKIPAKKVEDTNKLLYFSDIEKLISGIQEGSREVIHILGEFYRILNLEPLFFPEEIVPDGIRFTSSPTTSKLIALLNFIYIRLHSLLDYSTKLAFEIEQLRRDFSRYPRLASHNKVFGNRKNTKIDGIPGTLFENAPLIREVELIRNHVIHDGFLDEIPKVYQVKVNGEIAEKFILFPDRNKTGLEKFVNRKLFYSQIDKINLRLPSLVAEFQERQLQTLKVISSNI